MTTLISMPIETIRNRMYYVHKTPTHWELSTMFLFVSLCLLFLLRRLGEMICFPCLKTSDFFFHLMLLICRTLIVSPLLHHFHLLIID